MKIALEKLKVARDRQKKYADVKPRPVNFEVDDHVMLKVSPWKGFIRFGKRGKLSPRYIGSFKILKRVNDQAYSLELPSELAVIHSTFHVSHLRKCRVEDDQVLPLEDMQVDPNKRLIEEPIAIPKIQEARKENNLACES